MHTAIIKAFKRYHLFGFTGTPIFAANSASGGNPQRRTTEQAFGDKLHTYTIVDAITDKNVLPFRIGYVNTIKMPERVADKQVSAIDTEKALLAAERIRQVVAYILETLRPEDEAVAELHAEGTPGTRLQRPVRHRVHRCRQALLQPVLPPAEAPHARPATEGRPDLQLRRERRRSRRPARRGGLRPERARRELS